MHTPIQSTAPTATHYPSSVSSPSSSSPSNSITPPQHHSSTSATLRPLAISFPENQSTSSSSVSETTKSESATTSMHSVQELEPHSYIVPKQHDAIPFVEPIQVLQCDDSGGTFTSKPHEVGLYIPEGTIDPNSSLNIELGVTLHGPFVFAKDAKMKPVSPIVWLSVQEELPFHRHVELTLPHPIDCSEDPTILAFYKAQKKGKMYQFQRMRKPGFGIERGIGKVETKLSKGWILICIAGRANPDLVSKTNYCIVKAMPRSTDDPLWKIQFCIAFFLPTCIEVRNPLNHITSHYKNHAERNFIYHLPLLRCPAQHSNTTP